MTSYFREVCGLELGTDIDGRAQVYAETAESACWWWPHKDFVMVCERPTQINRNDRGVLHNESGMSIGWGDGWGLWHINGVVVDEQIVMRPESQTVAQIRGETNEEVRRIRIERFGWDRYLTSVDAKILDAGDDLDGIHQALMRTDKETVLCCACPSTGRTYAIEVNPNCLTVEQAQNYLLAPAEALRGIAPSRVIEKIRPMPVVQS